MWYHCHIHGINNNIEEEIKGAKFNSGLSKMFTKSKFIYLIYNMRINYIPNMIFFWYPDELEMVQQKAIVIDRPLLIHDAETAQPIPLVLEVI